MSKTMFYSWVKCLKQWHHSTYSAWSWVWQHTWWSHQSLSGRSYCCTASPGTWKCRYWCGNLSTKFSLKNGSIVVEIISLTVHNQILLHLLLILDSINLNIEIQAWTRMKNKISMLKQLKQKLYDFSLYLNISFPMFLFPCYTNVRRSSYTLMV